MLLHWALHRSVSLPSPSLRRGACLIKVEMEVEIRPKRSGESGNRPICGAAQRRGMYTGHCLIRVGCSFFGLLSVTCFSIIIPLLKDKVRLPFRGSFSNQTFLLLLRFSKDKHRTCLQLREVRNTSKYGEEATLLYLTLHRVWLQKCKTKVLLEKGYDHGPG